MKSHSVKTNLIFQIIYQTLVLIIPLITAPYLSRKLGETSLGIYTFTYTIAYYFVLFAMLGINKYGQRAIASCKDDDYKLRRTFWSLYYLHAIISFVCLALYLLVFFLFDFKNKNIFLIQSIYVLSALFDITWLFYGIENFKSVVIRNLILKILECTFIFIFVKAPCDLNIYTIIMASSTLLGQLCIFPICIKSIKPIKINILYSIKKHLKPLLIFSVSVLASLLYTMFDKTLLGFLSTKENLAFYEYSSKIINIPKTIAVVIGTVLFPRICNCYKNSNEEKISFYFRISIYFVFFISLGSIFGLFAISDILAIVYFGKNFSACGDIIKYLSPIIFTISLGNVIQNIFIIPLCKDKELVICIVVGAIVNIVLSTILIIYFDVMGAIIGTLVAETITFILQCYIERKRIDFRFLFNTFVPFSIFGIIMFLILTIIKHYMFFNILNLIVLISIGGTIFVIFTAIYLLGLCKDSDTFRKIVKKILLRK